MVLSPLEIWKQHVVAHPPITPTHGNLPYNRNGVDKMMKYREFEWNDLNLGISGTKRLKYTISVFGQQPPTGFPLFIGLHGGGKSKLNDEAWRHMSQGLYRDNIKDVLKVGVYVAPRGIVDDWNLHFRPESYILFQRLIRNLLHQKPEEANESPTPLNPMAQHFVDPNRIYFLGFSAGGDGVYRLSTVLADRLAATNMSAGHPGGVRFHNLANLPICLQVGEQDGDQIEHPGENGKLVRNGEFQRNERTVASANTLQALRETDKDSYPYDIFVHPTDGTKSWAHNSWERSDELSDRNDTLVFLNGARFRTDKTLDKRNTCAVRWVSKATRKPLASFVVWDLAPIPPSLESQPILPSEWGEYRFFYWLAIWKSHAVFKQPENDTDAVNTIRARYSVTTPSGQWIWIEQTPIPVIILLNSSMGFDFTKPVTVCFGKGGQFITLPQLVLNQYDTVQKATVDARGDPDYIFSATIVFDPVTKTARDGGSQIFSTTLRARL